MVLVHHVHREQWSILRPILARFGWFMESKVAVRVNQGTPYVAVSEVTRSELVALGVRAQDITIAWNGQPAPPSFEPPAPATAPRVVVLSRLVPHKRVEHALEAVAALRDELPGLHLHVMGSGWWSEHLLERRRELGLDDVVTFLGHVTDLEKFQELSSAWVHVLPSVKEGWGLSIVEAAQMGVPSVAYAEAGGVRESILDGVTGLLATDQDDLVDKLRLLLVDAELRADLGTKARIRSGQFSWDTTADTIAARLGTFNRSGSAPLDHVGQTHPGGATCDRAGDPGRHPADLPRHPEVRLPQPAVVPHRLLDAVHLQVQDPGVGRQVADSQHPLPSPDSERTSSSCGSASRAHPQPFAGPEVTRSGAPISAGTSRPVVVTNRGGVDRGGPLPARSTRRSAGWAGSPTSSPGRGPARRRRARPAPPEPGGHLPHVVLGLRVLHVGGHQRGGEDATRDQQADHQRDQHGLAPRLARSRRVAPSGGPAPCPRRPPPPRSPRSAARR